MSQNEKTLEDTNESQVLAEEFQRLAGICRIYNVIVLLKIIVITYWPSDIIMEKTLTILTVLCIKYGHIFLTGISVFLLFLLFQINLNKMFLL